MMEIDQFVPGALHAKPAPAKHWLLWLSLAVFVSLVVAACGGSVVEPVTVATPTPVVGDASQLPDTQDEQASTPTPQASQAEAATGAGPTGRAVEPTTPVRDIHGNLLAVHDLARWPDSYAALQPLGTDFPLAGDLDERFASATSITAIDVSVCARTLGDVDVAESTGTFTVGNAQAVPATTTNGSLTSSDTSLAPGFMWPQVGRCSRGWIAVATTAELTGELFVHYWPTGDDAGDNVLAWPMRVNTTAQGTAAESFAAAQTVTFNAGDLAGATVVVDGWAELVDAPAGAAGTRPVGLSVQACPSTTGAWPTLGLSVDGWNLAEAAPRTVEDLDALTSSTTACDTGWLIFDVPHGGSVDGAFVAEQPDTPGAHWSLLGAALPDPS